MKITDFKTSLIVKYVEQNTYPTLAQTKIKQPTSFPHKAISETSSVWTTA